jgi:ribonuclease III
MATRATDAVPQDELERLSTNRNVLAALLEAALGALFLEYGFERIEDAVVGAFAGRIEYARTTYVDHKTELQEALARLGRSVTYAVLDVEGPPHDRIFTCAAVIDGEEVGVGKGQSKKAAEQEAAREALAKLESS